MKPDWLNCRGVSWPHLPHPLTSSLQTWFTHLPPILVLELSRFKFNQQNNQAEKIHDHFTFDRELFMDRYPLLVSGVWVRLRKPQHGRTQNRVVARAQVGQHIRCCLLSLLCPTLPGWWWVGIMKGFDPNSIPFGKGICRI